MIVIASAAFLVIATAVIVITPFVWWRAIKAIREEWKRS